MPQAADLLRPSRRRTRSELSGGGTASIPVREKRSRAPVRSRHVPLSRPQPPQTAAKVRGFSPTAPGFTAETDSPLEGDGFEPSVPGEGTPTHATVTYDRYRRLSPAVRHLRPLTVAVAVRADTGVGGTQYIAK